ncbi:unnamed protein product [Prunus armeniaca]|uniref:ABC transporter domain-containing protein n=1 Tax=Prunus armeniaca TaxID=36596 RepID=A0A6J5VVW9_PRUAR|nr:unnamed protein product [Prunus armeniaca]
MISLGRLDRYMMSRELVEDAAKRDEGCDSRTAVEVKNGPFSCDDESKEEDLKHINLNVNKGELTAIVGTVGSGKSSLLALILGEMHKYEFVEQLPMLLKHHGFKMGLLKKIHYLVCQWTEIDTRKWSGFLLGEGLGNDGVWRSN